MISIGLDEQVEIYVTKDGKISKWGYDKYIGYQENYAGTLEPYAGRVEYYTQLDDEALQGKPKYIGRTLVTYYPSYENEILKKARSKASNINFDYYLSFDDRSYRGAIKSLGQQLVTWYALYDNEMLLGKLKSVGPHCSRTILPLKTRPWERSRASTGSALPTILLLNNTAGV